MIKMSLFTDDMILTDKTSYTHLFRILNSLESVSV